MSLRYALLAILRVGPLSGYDLQKQFAQSVGHVWHAPDSQIYPELRKMEEAGLVEGEDQVRGERGRRRVYHVTDAGNRAFVEWMHAPTDYQRVRDPAHLRAAYLESVSYDQAREFFRGHIAEWEGELEQWQGELRHIEQLSNPDARPAARGHARRRQAAHDRLQAPHLRGTRRARAGRDRLGASRPRARGRARGRD